MMPFGMPGIGGSLGECALCGKPFIAEILLGKRVKSITVSGVNNELYAHDDCIAKVGEGQFDVTSLPEESPLRKAYARQQDKRSDAASDEAPKEQK